MITMEQYTAKNYSESDILSFLLELLDEETGNKITSLYTLTKVLDLDRHFNLEFSMDGGWYWFYINTYAENDYGLALLQIEYKFRRKKKTQIFTLDRIQISLGGEKKKGWNAIKTIDKVLNGETLPHDPYEFV